VQSSEPLDDRRKRRELLMLFGWPRPAFALLTGLAGDAFSLRRRGLSGVAYPAFHFQGVMSWRFSR
jgi:hypothetical protein